MSTEHNFFLTIDTVAQFGHLGNGESQGVEFGLPFSANLVNVFHDKSCVGFGILRGLQNGFELVCVCVGVWERGGGGCEKMKSSLKYWEKKSITYVDIDRLEIFEGCEDCLAIVMIVGLKHCLQKEKRKEV